MDRGYKTWSREEKYAWKPDPGETPAVVAAAVVREHGFYTSRVPI